MSVRLLRCIRKNFGVCIPVCGRNSERKNYAFPLKFNTNVYVLCTISRIVFDTHCPSSAYTRTHKSISMYQGVWKKIP